jgi:hypothetical protein
MWHVPLPTHGVLYSAIKRVLKRILIYESRCNDRLKGTYEGSTHLIYRDWVVCGTGTTKDRDEVKRREV